MMILPRRGSDRVPDSVVLVIFVVAASLGTVFAKDTAFVEVVLFESSPNGDYTTYTTGLQGRFSKAGATISAEGEIVQGGSMTTQNSPQSQTPGFPSQLPDFSSSTP
ncbi:E3 ubiquitin-protein ligase znrf3-like [Cottoperca gobio]|uniref:E3 ubiquitin-protein ligase znrf3-like n=1 Tax=Cottoperca gobio TaxID=56716 RepID=A0A6J2QG43_COTGO|nr:E3 ubiquitin-protein ligase znrf3-like [Cottoperca gobio]